MIPPPIGKRLSETFNYLRGDLLYGLSAPRYDAFIFGILGSLKYDEPLDDDLGVDGLDIHHLTIDGYQRRAQYAYKEDGKLSVNQIDHIKGVFVGERGGYPVNFLERFLHQVNNHSKYNWNKADRDNNGRIQQKGIKPDDAMVGVNSRLLLSRNSKLGLDIVAEDNTSSSPVVHFTLDGIDLNGMASIVNKEGGVFAGHSFTASELRFAFRNRVRLDGKLLFYRKHIVTLAPWDSNPDLWGNRDPWFHHLRDRDSELQRPKFDLKYL